MKKVGIITFHRYHNYGGVLQAYATSKAINKFDNYSSEIIDYYQKNGFAVWNYRLYEIGHRTNSYRFLPWKWIYFNKTKKRYEKFEKFIKDNFMLSKYYSSSKELEGNSAYDIYLSGSDQIWSKGFENSSNKTLFEGRQIMLPYYLNFTDSPNKISYASSMGNAITGLVNNKFLISKYKKIFTREKRQAKYLNKHLNREDVTQVVDPTLLLKYEDYSKVINMPKIKYKYIFAYLFDYNLREYKNSIELVKKLGKKLGLKVILVNNTIPINKFGIKTLVDVGPAEWMGLIKNAELVITNSFHGTAFSINFNTPFFTISNDERKTTILEMLKLKERNIISTADINQLINYKLDFSEANIILEKERIRSKKLLKDALDSCE